MLRPTDPADTPALLQMARDTAVFYPHEIDVLEEVIAEYHAGGEDGGPVMRTWEEAGTPVGFVHFCPAPMTVGTWELWWIVVAKDRHGQGLGRRLLAFVEQEVRDRGGRALFIETSSTPPYEPTRRFYLRCGYSEVARLPGYYRQGDDKVIFVKETSAIVG
jgi:GNAT superfamily N-acetyltransferase